MSTAYAKLVVFIGTALFLSGCCASLLSAYERDQEACLERHDSYEEAKACVEFVRFVYRDELEVYGCD